MRTVKVITVGLDESDPIQFCTDLDANLLARMRAAYEGRCFGGCYVQKVERILARGGPRVEDDGGCHIDVMMEVVAVFWGVGEPIGETLIRKKTDAVAFGVSERERVSVVLPLAKLRAIGEGLKVPAIVAGQVSYRVGQGSATAVGDLLSAQSWQSPQVFEVADLGLDPSSAGYIRTYLEWHAAAAAKLEAAGAKRPDRLKYFKSLMAPAAPAAPADGWERVEIFPVVRAALAGEPPAAGSLWRADTAGPEGAVALRRVPPAGGAPPAGAGRVNLFTLLMHLVLRQLHYQEALLQMLEAYGPQEEFDRHAVLWATLERLQG